MREDYKEKRLDLTNPSQFRLAVRNATNMWDRFPEMHEEAHSWYPTAHETGLSFAKQAGIQIGSSSSTYSSCANASRSLARQ